MRTHYGQHQTRRTGIVDNNKLTYGNVIVDADGIHVDGHRIDGLKIQPGVTIKRSTPNEVADTITFTLYADTITITDEAKAMPSAMITET